MGFSSFGPIPKFINLLSTYDTFSHTCYAQYYDWMNIENFQKMIKNTTAWKLASSIHTWSDILICCCPNQKLRCKPNAKLTSYRIGIIKFRMNRVQWNMVTSTTKPKLRNPTSFHIQTVTQTQSPCFAFLHPTLVFYIYTTDTVMRGNRTAKQRCTVCHSFSLLDIEDLLYLPDLLTAYRTKTRSFSYPADCTSNFWTHH